jgi:hypothetical protein
MSILKAQFKEHKKFGSRDRKIISALLFGYFRLGQQAQLKEFGTKYGDGSINVSTGEITVIPAN